MGLSWRAMKLMHADTLATVMFSGDPASSSFCGPGRALDSLVLCVKTQAQGVPWWFRG